MKDRIVKIIELEEISSSKFADEIGVQRSSISHILSGRNKPSLDFINKILSRYRNINADWLLTGRGEIHKEFKHEYKHEEEEINTNTNNEPAYNNTQQEAPLQQVIEKKKNITRIVVYYDDNSFEELFPEKKQ